MGADAAAFIPGSLAMVDMPLWPNWHGTLVVILSSGGELLPHPSIDAFAARGDGHAPSEFIIRFYPTELKVLV